MSDFSRIVSFLSNQPVVQVTKNKAVRVAGRLVTNDQAMIQQIFDALPAADRSAFQALLDGTRILDPSYASSIKRSLIESAPQEASKVGEGIAELATLRYAGLPKALGRYDVIYDASGKKRHVLYDREEQKSVHRVDVGALWAYVESGYGKQVAQSFRASAKPKVVEYRALEEGEIIDDGVAVFNSWGDAAWKKSWTPPKEKTNAPPEFLDFIDHFVTSQESRTACLYALRDTVFRSEGCIPILVLIEPRGGVGKNMLVRLMSALVGEHNYMSAQHGFNRSQFQGQLATCRLFFLDELDPENKRSVKAILKRLHNKRNLTFESKHANIKGTENICATLVVASNDLDSLGIVYSDRKFLVLDLTKETIEEWKGGPRGAEAYHEMWASKIQNEEFLKSVASYLYSNFEPDLSQVYSVKTKAFHELASKSLPSWILNLKDRHIILEPGTGVRVSPKEVFPRGKGMTYEAARKELSKYVSESQGYLDGIDVEILDREKGTYTFILGVPSEEQL